MADILHTVSVISFVAAGVFFVVVIALWFIFKIPSVMGDLSGRTARKSIERMRQKNEKTGSYKASEKKIERVKLPRMMEGRGKSSGHNDETGLLNENLATNYEEQATGLLIDDSTGSLEDSRETTPLEESIEKIVRPAPSVSIKMLGEIMYVHTEEIIIPTKGRRMG